MQHDTYPKCFKCFFSLAIIFDGIKIAKILLHVDVHEQVRFLNLFILFTDKYLLTIVRKSSFIIAIIAIKESKVENVQERDIRAFL